MKNTEQYKEVRGKLGFFGWVTCTLLGLWQILMIGWIVDYAGRVSPIISESGSEIAQAGAGIGTAIGMGIILFVWVCGTIIFGIFALLTRPAKTFVPL